MIILFLLIPMVMALRKELIRPPGMYPPEELSNKVPTMPRNPYQSNSDDVGSMDYQFYYEKDPKDSFKQKKQEDVVFVNNGPPLGNPNPPGPPRYINESPRSPAPPPPMVAAPLPPAAVLAPPPAVAAPPPTSPPSSFPPDPQRRLIPLGATYPSEPEFSYEGNISDGPTPPGGAAPATSPHDSRDIGWTPVPKVLRGSNDQAQEKLNGPPEPPPAREPIAPPSAPILKSDGGGGDSSLFYDSSNGGDPADKILGRSKSPDYVPNATGEHRAGHRPSASPYTPNASTPYDPLGAGETETGYPGQGPENDGDQLERRQDKHHLRVGKINESSSHDHKMKVFETKLQSDVDALTGEEGNPVGATLEETKIPTVRVSMTPESMERQPSQTNQSSPDDTDIFKQLSENPTESQQNRKGNGLDDVDTLQAGNKCCPCCRDAEGPQGRGQDFSRKSINDGLSEITAIGDRIESSSSLRSSNTGPHVLKQITLTSHGAIRGNEDDFESKVGRIGSTPLASKMTPRSGLPEGAQLTSLGDLGPSQGGTYGAQQPLVSVSVQQRLIPSSATSSYAIPSLPFSQPQSSPQLPLSLPSPQFTSQYSAPALGYSGGGPIGASSFGGFGGCPCPVPQQPCCAPVQPCCIRPLPCCPAPPPMQCCPQPPVCCQPPPCCPPPPPPVIPTIPTCFRPCPSCPCRRRLHRSLRMKRSPGLNRGCQQCTAAGQPKLTARMKRQANCRACDNSLASIFAPLSTASSCSSCKRSDHYAARVKRMGCLPCGGRKKRDVEEEHYRRVKRTLGCMPCSGRKKRSPMQSNCKQCSNLGQVFQRFKRTIVEDTIYGSCDKSCCDYTRCNEVSGGRALVSRSAVLKH
ncbi:unnamed protein product [Cylicocyclus nassatus]|uniref:Uncharacterized protein n=1 Tax=Cylicocyclus nassatus TaxID=53992 RepID=A0AA36M1U4_CYLNA|nr:unnamed protein product [Cylicocyclus nassatus]